MARNITITFEDGTSHVYQNAPDSLTPSDVQARAEKDFGKSVSEINGGRSGKPRGWADVPVEAAKNVIPSAGNLLSGIASAVVHPINTVSSVMDIAAGGLRHALPDSAVKALDYFNTPSMQADADKASATASAVGKFYKDRYGGMDNLRDTLATDPVGAAADAATVLSGGAGLAKLGAKVPMLASKAPAVAQALDSASQAINPLRPLVNIASSGYQKAIPVFKTNPGNLLANAIGATPQEAKAIAAAAMAAPKSIVNGSDLTLAQALQHQGAKNSAVSLLERTASGGPGGNALLNRYANQSDARLAAFANQGAEMNPQLVGDVAENIGNRIGSIIRTQAADDQLAAKHAWVGANGNGGVYGQALTDNVRLKLPLDAMENAMSPLGRGSVLPAKDARSVLQTANEIGTMKLPPIEPMKAGKAINSQSLEQAVRSEGGIRGGAGEIRDLGIKQSGTTGLVNNKSGKSADLLAQTMFERGFLPDADPATLFDALRNGGGRKLFANDAVENNGFQRMSEANMGDLPEATRIPVSVPFAEYQRLRRDSGSLAAKVGERAGGETEAGVLNRFQGLLAETADQAVDAGLNGSGLLGENMSPEFLRQYNSARALTKQNADLYKGGNNVSQILRKPSGQNYALSGNEITSKLWHGGEGLAGDVQSFKNVLNANNFNPAVSALQKHVLTDAASRTKASGSFGSALPNYVESRMPGMRELLTPDQLDTVTSVSKDIRNAEAAANVEGLRGSDTQAKITRALDAGMLEGPLAKTFAKYSTFHGVGGEMVRSKLAQMVMENKGKVIADLLANPKAAAQALHDADFVQQIDTQTFRKLSATAKLAPVLAERATEPTRR
jgi:hypothetical protein